MANIVLLLITEFILIVLMYYFTNGNLLSPALVTYVFFAVATLCILINIEFWNVSFSITTYAIILAGFIAMAIPEFFFINYKQVSYEKNKYVESKVYPPIHLNQMLNTIIITLGMCMLLLQIYRVFTLGDFSSKGMYAIGAVKQSEDSYDILIRLATRYLQVIGVIYSYIIIKNVIYHREKVRKNTRYFMPIILYIASMFFYGNRAGFVKFLGIIYVFFVVMKNDGVTEKRVKLSEIIKPMFVGGILVIVGFYLLRGISKVNSTAAQRNFVDYMTYYIGSSLYLFDKYVANPLHVHGADMLFGQMSLTSIYTTFGYKLENANNYTLVGGASNFAGNEYSWFQRPMADFGIVGMIVFTILIYGIFDYIYYIKIYNCKKNKKRNRNIVVYAYFFYIPIMAFYYCQVCFAFSMVTVVSLIIMMWGINNIGRIKLSIKA